jgi:hypothetical protein
MTVLVRCGLQDCGSAAPIGFDGQNQEQDGSPEEDERSAVGWWDVERNQPEPQDQPAGFFVSTWTTGDEVISLFGFRLVHRDKTWPC